MISGTSICDVLGLTDLVAHTRSNCEEAGAEYLRIASKLQALEIVLASRDVGSRELSDLSEIHPEGTRYLRRLMSDCKVLVSKLNRVATMVSISELEQYQQGLDICVEGFQTLIPTNKDPLDNEDTARFPLASD